MTELSEIIGMIKNEISWYNLSAADVYNAENSDEIESCQYDLDVHSMNLKTLFREIESNGYKTNIDIDDSNKIVEFSINDTVYTIS